jgi:hypothetical protein
MEIRVKILPPAPPKMPKGSSSRVHARAKWECKPVYVRPSTPITEPEFDPAMDAAIAYMVKEMQDAYCRYEDFKRRLAVMQGQNGNPNEKQLVFPFAVKMIVVE